MDNDSYDKEVETFHTVDKKSMEENEDYMGGKKTSLTEVIVENGRSDKETLSEKDLHRIYVM